MSATTRERPAVLEALNYARQGGVDAATAKAVGDFERSVAGRRPEPEPARDAATSWMRCARRRATSASGSTSIAPSSTAGGRSATAS